MSRRIGLLGGSFNPAHDGHRHLSLQALKHLRLDEVWWLVSPQNPLKSAGDMADYDQRLSFARDLVRHPKIRVLDFELREGTKYTVDTIKRLQKIHKEIDFVWLMGADNLTQFHRWRLWRSIFRLLPVAVFDRAPFSHKALRGHAALRFEKWRISSQKNGVLALLKPPAWTFIYMPRHPESASNLRKKLGKDAFLRHNKDAGKK